MYEKIAIMEILTDEQNEKYLSLRVIQKDGIYNKDETVLKNDSKFKNTAEKYFYLTPEQLDERLWYSSASSGYRSKMITFLDDVKETFKYYLENDVQVWPVNGYLPMPDGDVIDSTKQHNEGLAFDAECCSTLNGYDTSMRSRLIQNKRILNSLRENGAKYSYIICKGTASELKLSFIHVSNSPESLNPNNYKFLNWENPGTDDIKIYFSNECLYDSSSADETSEGSEELNKWLSACQTVTNFYVKNVTTCGSGTKYSSVGETILNGGVYDTNAGFIMACLRQAGYITDYDNTYNFSTFHDYFVNAYDSTQTYTLDYEPYYRNSYEAERYFNGKQTTDTSEIKSGDIVITSNKTFVVGKSGLSGCYGWNSIHSEETTEMEIGESEYFFLYRFTNSSEISENKFLYCGGDDSIVMDDNISESSTNSRLQDVIGIEVLQRIDKVYEALCPAFNNITGEHIGLLLKCILVAEHDYTEGVTNLGLYANNSFKNTDNTNSFKFTEGSPRTDSGDWEPFNVISLMMKSIINSETGDKILSLLKSLHPDENIDGQKDKIKEILSAGGKSFTQDNYKIVSKELLFDIEVGCAMLLLSDAKKSYMNSGNFTTNWLGRALDDDLLKIMYYNAGAKKVNEHISNNNLSKVRDCMDILYIKSDLANTTKNYCVIVMALFTYSGAISKFPYASIRGVFSGGGHFSAADLLNKLYPEGAWGDNFLDQETGD